MSYVPFSHLSAEPCVVSWSEDQRIAVTTNELVYVLVSRQLLSSDILFHTHTHTHTL